MSQEINVVQRTAGVFVRYVGKTETYPDNLFGTGLWSQGEVKEVVPDVAMRMFRHPDQYVQTEQAESGTDAVAVGSLPVDRSAAEESDDQKLRDSISRMGAEQVRQYIAENFRQKVDGRLGLDALRQKAVQLIDQYGTS